jgi:hypothetical protein
MPVKAVTRGGKVIGYKCPKSTRIYPTRAQAERKGHRGKSSKRKS